MIMMVLVLVVVVVAVEDGYHCYYLSAFFATNVYVFCCFGSVQVEVSSNETNMLASWF